MTEAYAHNNPMKYVDPSGHSVKKGSLCSATEAVKNVGELSEGGTGSANVLPRNKNFIGAIKEGDNHLIYGEGIGQKKKGVLGGHNQNSFYKALQDSGFSLDDLLVGEPIEHPCIKGIYSQKYRVPAYDGRGNFIGYKDIQEPKTYFDPNIISNEQMINWANEAMNNGVTSGRFIDGISSNGLEFRGIIQSDGQLRYYPHFRNERKN